MSAAADASNPSPSVHSPHDLRTRARNAKAVALDLFARIGHARTLGLAAEMSFWLFLSLIPLAAVAGLVAARFVTHNSHAAQLIFQSTPPAMREFMNTELGQVAAWNGGSVGPIAALTFIWLASSGVHSIFDAIEEEVGIARPWWKKRLLACGACLVLSIGVCAITLLGTGIDWFARASGDVVGGAATTSIVSKGVRIALGGGVAFGLVCALFAIGTSRSVRKKMMIVPGAIFVVVVQVLLGWGYGVYVKTVGDGGAYQAGLAVIGVTMMSIYLFSVVLLIGVEVNLMFGSRRFARLRARLHPAAPPA